MARSRISHLLGSIGNVFYRLAGAAPAPNSYGATGWHWPNTGWIGGIFGNSPAAGIPVTQETAMTAAAVYACTQARAETLASLPPMVYMELATNSRRRDSENPVWRLLHDQPNPNMDSMTFWELMNMRIVNRGNGFAQIVRDGRDRPVELWPLHNSRVEPQLARDGTLQWRIYTDPDPKSHLNDATDQPYRYYTIPDRDMLNVPGFGSNGVIGRGVIPAAAEEISANLAMTQYSSEFFRSGARPAMAALHPGYEDDDEKRRIMRSDLNAAHSGRENWHQIPILWEGMKFQEIQVSPEQSQLLATKQYSAKTICQFYKVPPAIVQIFEDYKFASVDAMIQQFVMTCLRADAVRIERAVRRKITHTTNGSGQLVAVFDSPYVFEFVLEALLRGDSKKQAEMLEIERKNGIINADEWRSLNNREPLPDDLGQMYTIASGTENLATLGRTYENSRGNSSGGSGASQDRTRDASRGSGDQEAEDSHLPAFDRQRLYQALESGIPKHHDRSRGGSVADASTPIQVLDDSLAEVFSEAVGRIELILDKELAKASGDSSVEKAWQKHRSRLESAIRPACGMYVRYRDCPAAQEVASTVAYWAASNRQRLSGRASAETITQILESDPQDTQE